MEILKQPPAGGAGGDGPDRVVQGLVERGYAVMPGYFSPFLVRALRHEAAARHGAGEFSRAGIGRRDGQHRNDLVRRDSICWLEGGTLAQCRLFEEMEKLRQAINRSLFLGLFELEAHFARYPEGAFYRRHLDAFRGHDGRVVSTVIYLNEAWVAGDGGCLRLWPDSGAGAPALDVAPRGGTLVSFLSERIPHEVLPARRERLSIAGWFRRNRTTTEWLDPPS